MAGGGEAQAGAVAGGNRSGRVPLDSVRVDQQPGNGQRTANLHRGVPAYKGPTEPDYWQWPVFPGTHCYEVLSAPICAVSECDYNDVINVLNEKAVHPKQVETFDPGSVVIHEGDVDLPIRCSGEDTVRVETIRADNGLQIGVLNTTLKDHGLHPGTVRRTGVVYEGNYRILTVGKGTGPWGEPNVTGAEGVWGEIDQLIIDEFRGQR